LSLFLSPLAIPKQEIKTTNSFSQQLQHNRKTQFCISGVRYLGSEILQGLPYLESEQPQSQKKKSEKCKKIINGNASLAFFNLHLYDDSSPKQARINKFGAVFANQGFGEIF
jgi:hypothetical protein